MAYCYNIFTGTLDKYRSDSEIEDVISINEDTEYYVDGDSGSDSNGGTSWADAKKTLDFLYSQGIGALPRIIDAAVTVNVRGTVLSVGTIYHTRIDNFRGSGSLTIIGETTDEATGIAVTGQDNVASSITYHTYLDASGASWAANEHQGRFIVITGGTGAGATLYPIMTNTATRLETMCVPNTDGTTVIKIVSVFELKGAQVSDPSTIVDYSDNVFELKGLLIPLNVQQLDLRNVTHSNKFRIEYTLQDITFKYVSINMWLRSVFATFLDFYRCFLQIDGYRWIDIVDGAAGYINHSILYSSDDTGYGVYCARQGRSRFYHTRIHGMLIAYQANEASVAHFLPGNFFEECGTAIMGIGTTVEIAPYDSGYINFKNVVTALNLSGSRHLIGNAIIFQGTGVTTEVLVSDEAGDAATFSDLNSQTTIENTATGASVGYINTATYLPIQNPEYDNTSSGLAAMNFQDAIDELDTALDDSYTYETITADIDFTASAEEDVTISLGKEVREVVRARLYIDEDPGAVFSAYATYTFYSKAAKHGADAFYRTQAKLVYTELEVATTGSDSDITPDDHTDFNPNDLAYIIDGGSSEFVRLATIANTMVAEDNVAAHAIDTGLVRVSEFSGFSLFNTESGTDVYIRVGFAAAQTVSLKVELLVRK